MKSPGDTLFSGEFTDTLPSPATLSTAPRPHPLPSSVKMPKFSLPSTGTGSLDPAGVETTNCKPVKGKGYLELEGSWKLIWLGDTYKRGARIPFTATEVPARAVGSGKRLAACVPAARLLPKMETIEP